MTTMQIDRAVIEQALEALEYAQQDRECPSTTRQAIAALRAALAQQAEPVEPVAWEDWWRNHGQYNFRATAGMTFERAKELMKLAFEVGRESTPPQRKPMTIERLRDALVASRIIPPAAVEDPDGYDDGVTLHRIEALHRRLT